MNWLVRPRLPKNTATMTTQPQESIDPFCSSQSAIRQQKIFSLVSVQIRIICVASIQNISLEIFEAR